MPDRDASARDGVPLLRGKGTAPGLACGPLLRNAPDLQPETARGAVLVAERAVPEDVGRILASAGTLTISGAVLSHVSLLSREFGKPSVFLGPRGPARLVPEGAGKALLELTGVSSPGAGSAPALFEGDIVEIDGDAGTLAIPGGLGEDSRRAIRSTHAALLEFALRPESRTALRSLVSAAEAGGEAAAAHAIRAAVLHRLVPPGLACRTLLDGLRSSRGLRAESEGIAAGLVERIAALARSRCRRATEEIPLHGDLAELDRSVAALRGSMGRDVERVEDLGASPSILAGLLEPALAAAECRRAELVARLEQDLRAACTISPDGVSARLASLFRLAGNAKSAGVAGADLECLESRLARALAETRERSGTRLAVPLAAGEAPDRSLVGGKAAGLLEIRDALPGGCRIPRGFVVTSSAYRRHILGERTGRLRDAIRESADAAALSRRARAILLSGELPGDVIASIEDGLAGLGSAILAVRSSATVEDSPEGSLAGLLDSWIGVRGRDETLRRVRLAWASLWNAGALRAMAEIGVSPLDAGQAVVIQEVVDSRAAGVLLSRDPGGPPDTILVNAAWGLGEAISRGEVEGDTYRVRRGTGEIVAAETGRATTCLALDPSGTGAIEVTLPPERAGRPCLDAADLSRLAALAAALEGATGRPQDVEFGIGDDGGVFVFQARPLVPARTAPEPT